MPHTNHTGLAKLLTENAPLTPPVGWVVDVQVVGDRVRRHVQDVLQRHSVVDQVLRDGCQASDLLGRLLATACDEALHLADRDRQVGQRRVQIGPAVVHHAGQTGQPVLEHDDLLLAVTQCADEDLQVLDDVDDVAAAFGENPCDTGQLGQRRPELVTVAVHRVGRTVDEPSDGGVRDCALRAGLGSQFGCQAHQLGLDLIPLHGYCCPVAGDHRVVGHLRPVALPVCRRELHIARRDQILRDDHGLGVGRHRYVAVDLEDQLGFGALGFDALDGADFDAGHPHLVAGIDGRRRREIRGDGFGTKEDLAHQEHRSGHQHDGQQHGDPGRQALTGCHHRGGLLVVGSR